MANIGSSVKKLRKNVKKVDPLMGGDKLLDQAGLPTILGEEAGILNTPEIPEPEEQTVIPIPDDSLRANEARRRRARRAQTGRQSTRLTEGLGG